MAIIHDIGVSAAINLLSALAFLIAFATLRLQPVNDRVYFPKWHLKGIRGSPTYSRGYVGKFVNVDCRMYIRFLNWMPQALQMPEPELIEHAGLDSVTLLDIEFEKERSELEQGKESDEAWGQTLAAFKEQALKLQSVSQEAYEIYWKKAMVVLKETAHKLKIEAAKAKYDLSIIAQEFGEEGSQYIAQAAGNSPEPVKEVVETPLHHQPKMLKDVSEIHDFYVGVPYGAILSLGGFLNFMITGSTSAIRFGVILGGILLALSVSSLKSWRKGKPADSMILKCETAIAGILFVRHLRLFSQKLSFPGLISTAISVSVAVFFIYRLIMFGQDTKETNIDGEPQT